MPSQKASIEAMVHSATPTDLSRLFTEGSAYAGVLSVVYSFLPWPQRLCDAPVISKVMQELYHKRGYVWRGLCEQLCAEAKLHFPFEHADAVLLAGGDGNWCALFRQLWPLRHRFVKVFDESGDAVDLERYDASAERFRIAAHCRMKPAKTVAEDSVDAPAQQNTAVSIKVMPLHQRIALLRQSHPDLTQKQAMQRLLAKVKGNGDEEPSDGSEEVGSSGYTASVLSVKPGAAGNVLTVSPGIGIRSWEFDNVFPEASRQQDIHRQCGLRLAMDLVNGSSGALIVYGQTGSGKTYTMFGPSKTIEAGVEVGLVPSIADEVLDSMEARRRCGFEVAFGASYIEVFGNDVRNLLGGDADNLSLNQTLGHRHVLEGRCEVAVSSREAFSDLLGRGADNRRQAMTAMNERSSRAHTLVMLRLRQRAPGKENFLESTLCLVDLGGSERVSKSKANELIRNPGSLKSGDEEFAKVSWAEYYQGRERITETNYINKGLLTLKRCMQALIERQKFAKENPGVTLPRVPFMDSKLTMLLEPSLGGDSNTSLIICCSPEDYHAEETVQSLRVGEMCSYVQQERRSGSAPDANTAVAHALEAIDSELRQLEADIRQKERLEWRAKTQTHIVSEMNAGGTVMNKDEVMELGGTGAVEIHADDGLSLKREVEHDVWGQVFVGAETENARRDELLQRRQRLLGGSD